MKISIAQLRKVIKEEVSKSLRRVNEGKHEMNYRKTAKAEPWEIGEILVDLVGSGYTDDYESAAQEIINIANELRDMGSYDEVYEKDSRESIAQELDSNVKEWADVADKEAVLSQIMDEFFGPGAPWTDSGEDEEEDEDDLEKETFRRKFPGALETLEAQTDERFDFNKAWHFYEEHGRLWAIPSVSGYELFWDPKSRTWEEDDR